MAPTLKDAPIWFRQAVAEIGTREQPGNRGPAIDRYIKLGKCGAQGSPWCAVFVNAMLETSGISGTRSALAQSFSRDKRFVKLSSPALGAIVVYWRGTRKSGLGHVGFCNGIEGDYCSTVSGNESDMVREEMYAMTGKSNFGLVGFYWPASVPLPKATGKFAPVIRHGTKGVTGSVI
jgi:uncharacterized protein (TIGR02594 family)